MVLYRKTSIIDRYSKWFFFIFRLFREEKISSRNYNSHSTMSSRHGRAWWPSLWSSASDVTVRSPMQTDFRFEAVETFGVAAIKSETGKNRQSKNNVNRKEFRLVLPQLWRVLSFVTTLDISLENALCNWLTPSSALSGNGAGNYIKKTQNFNGNAIKIINRHIELKTNCAK